jgi:hypothetical protein
MGDNFELISVLFLMLFDKAVFFWCFDTILRLCFYFPYFVFCFLEQMIIFWCNFMERVLNPSAVLAGFE